MTDPQTPAIAGTPYKDDDLVYVDPDTKAVIGPVEWSKNGNPKSKSFAHADAGADKEKKGKKDREERRRSGRKHYPWGTYRSMKRAFKLEGKQKKSDPNATLDDVMVKALDQPFWD